MSIFHRRDFARSAAAVASAAALAAQAELLADDKPKHKDEPKHDDSTATKSKTETETDARMSYILARFGGHLDPSARKTIRAEIDGLVRRSEALRKFPLDNGDGPFPVFRPYRGPLK